MFDPFRPMNPPQGPSQPSGAPVPVMLAQGRFFTFALPHGWRVGEDGQFAVVLHSPDNRAMTVVVGNAGLPVGYPPGQFAYEKLAALQVQQLQFGPPRPAQPAPGLAQACEFDVRYFAGPGIPVQGVAKVSASGGYDGQVMVMNAALAQADQWPYYAHWLPRVADQVSAIDGNAFGARGVMAQNLQNSVAYGQQAQQYRDWSQQTWQGVTDARNASVDRQNAEFRENLGAVGTWQNPHGFAPPVELSTQYAFYWMDAQGRIVGTNDPGADPNAGSTGNWRRMDRVRR